MATFTERIRLVIDATADGATSAFTRLKTSVSQADGFVNKFKAGASSAMSTVQANAGAFAATAGAALLTFGIKAVHAFESTAKAAIDLAAATGLSTEAASRWVAVGDDMGVTAEQLTTGIGRIGKTLDGGTWEKYGIATRDAAGEARDANAILLDAFDALGRITNETERAKVGNELFGKGYANLAPMIGKTRAEYEAMLGAVEDGQVITDKEAKKAERMRLAEDALADALGEVTMAVGEVVAGMAPFLESVSKSVSRVTELADAIGALDIAGRAADPMQFLTGGTANDVIDPVTLALDEFVASMQRGVFTADNARPILEKWVSLHADAGVTVEQLMSDIYGVTEAIASEDGAAQRAATRVDQLSGAQDRAAESAATAEDRTRELQDALDDLTRKDKELDLADSFDDLRAAAEAAWIATAEGAEDAEEKQRDYQRAQIDTSRLVAEYATELAKLPPEMATAILALIDDGKFAEAEAKLARLARTRTVGYVPQFGPGYGDGNAGGSGPNDNPYQDTRPGREQSVAQVHDRHR